MSEHLFEKEILELLRLLSSSKNLTQRDLSQHLNISLGKTNYLLKELVKAGLLEIRNFVDGNNKFQKVKYYLTKEGIEERTRLMLHFLKEKEAEYNKIKKEWEELNGPKLEITQERK